MRRMEDYVIGINPIKFDHRVEKILCKSSRAIFVQSYGVFEIYKIS